jgi:hypothetical protein
MRSWCTGGCEFIFLASKNAEEKRAKTFLSNSKSGNTKI